MDIEFLVPKNLTETKAILLIAKGTSQRLRSVSVLIPPGHKGLTYLKIEAPGGFILPRSSSNVKWLRGDDTTITANVNRLLEGPPYNIYCWAYNTDEYLDHSFYINFDLIN